MTPRFQPIYDIAALCAKKNICDVVLCPGSRNAPLALAFLRHPGIVSKTISDERSAGFIALGIAQRTGVAPVLLCTSGTAAFNFAPAVAEAFFSNTPMIVFTADRPKEWIAQQDGQTIFQPGIYGKHVKQCFELPQEYDHADSRWEINRLVNEAINLAMQDPQGPVHINAPFREPLYPEANEQVLYSEKIRVMEQIPSRAMLSEEQKESISAAWPSFHNVLIVAGQQSMDENFLDSLSDFAVSHGIPVIGDVISNLHPVGKVISHAEAFLGEARHDIRKTLQPDLLITFGAGVISKNVKLFLREHAPVAHWHVQPAGTVPDTFRSITHIYRSHVRDFLDFLNSLISEKKFESQKQENYDKFWEVEERRALRSLDGFFPRESLAEFELVNEVIKNLPSTCNLHLANSMSVRYANYIGLSAAQKGVKVFSNRGTSGIDGCTSTTVGHALDSDVPNILITGDMAFFYDRNAFWHNYPLPNLRIVLLNNHGGVIFKILDGPSNIPEGDEFFITHQRLNGRKLCEEYSFDYLLLDNRRKMKNLLKDFFDFDGKTKLMELESDILLSKTIFDQMKHQIKRSYEA